MRIGIVAVAALMLAGTGPAWAACTRCVSTTSQKPSSVVPADRLSININGDQFSNQFQSLAVAGNGSVNVALGFNVTIGDASFSSVNVSENGALAFGGAIGGGGGVAQRGAVAGPVQDGRFVPVDSLRELGVPVIAPFYADLIQDPNASQREPSIGDIFVQYGFADPVPDGNGRYSISDLLPAVRITWYGLEVASGEAISASAVGDLAFAQILFTDEGGGNFNFEFRAGDPRGDPPYSQDGLGSIAGFVLGDDIVEFRGPYDDGPRGYFAFRDGALAVPEPATWLLSIVGFGLIGAVLRRRRTLALPALAT